MSSNWNNNNQLSDINQFDQALKKSKPGSRCIKIIKKKPDDVFLPVEPQPISLFGNSETNTSKTNKTEKSTQERDKLKKEFLETETQKSKGNIETKFTPFEA